MPIEPPPSFRLNFELERWHRLGWGDRIPIRPLSYSDDEYRELLAVTRYRLHDIGAKPGTSTTPAVTPPSRDLQNFLVHCVDDETLTRHPAGGWVARTQPDVAALLDLVYPDWQQYLETLDIAEPDPPALRLYLDDRGRSHRFSPGEVEKIHAWAVRNHYQLPVGIMSLTPEVISAYYARPASDRD